MEENKVRQHLKDALDQLISQDKFLLQYDVNERSISHKLAVYLEQRFPGWNVDSEYNRIGEDHVKKTIEIENLEQCYKNRKADLKEVAVYPDIIIHERGKQNNLVVIEVKKAWDRRGKECDLLKLQAYKNQLGYRFTFFVEFEIDSFRVFDENSNELKD